MRGALTLGRSDRGESETVETRMRGSAQLPWTTRFFSAYKSTTYVRATSPFATLVVDFPKLSLPRILPNKPAVPADASEQSLQLCQR